MTETELPTAPNGPQGRPNGRQRKALGLLDREREIILAGPLAELEALVAKREALVDSILADAAPPPEGFLVALKAKAERNSRLLLAALAGLRAGQEQIAEASAARATLRTYTAAGSARDVLEPPASRDTRR
jgi:hypothetical protein